MSGQRRNKQYSNLCEPAFKGATYKSIKSSDLRKKRILTSIVERDIICVLCVLSPAPIFTGWADYAVMLMHMNLFIHLAFGIIGPQSAPKNNK